MKFLIIPVLALSLMNVTAEASRNRKREVRQQARIGQGVQSGQLTRKEAKKLRRGQKKVDQLQTQASADGVVTPQEKLRLEKAQDRQSRRIHRQKHDDQQRGGNNPPAPATPPPADSGVNTGETAPSN